VQADDVAGGHAVPRTVSTGEDGDRLAAVLFDMDGTLVDSEKVWDVGLRELAERYGGELSVRARVEMVGTSMAHSMGILHRDIGQPWREVAASVRWLEARVGQLFADGLVWRPGARELLAEVRAAGVPTALVTATRRPLVERALTTIGRHNFDVVVCGDEVDQAKPHPTPYRTACALLGVDVRRCVAIEDSPTGVASAHAAGCVVVAVPCEVAVADREGLTVVDSLAQLTLERLRELVAAAARPRDPAPGAARS
jgi:HAD superfamily hydrolase (TIGR01509 family)